MNKDKKNISTDNQDNDNTNTRSESSVICTHCGKKMVPRLILYEGVVQRSVCPFCQETYMTNKKRFRGCLVMIVFGIIIFSIVLLIGHVL